SGQRHRILALAKAWRCGEASGPGRPNSVGQPQLLLLPPSSKRALDWSPDGRFILLLAQWQLYTIPVTPDVKVAGTPPAFATTNNGTRIANARFSPDGRWIAYQSSQSGADE